MSEAAQIYVRYNGLNGKGLIANYYGWCYGERLVSRARYGIEWIMEHLDSKRYYYDKSNLIKLSKILDINFDFKDVLISGDIIKDRLDWYPKEDFKESVFLTQQNDDGKLFIDICEDCVKYAFTDWNASTEHIMDAESYMVWNSRLGPEWRSSPCIEKDMLDACEENMKYLSENATLMTPEELEDFINCEYRDFLFEAGTKEARLKQLCEEAILLLNVAPAEDECTEQEREIYFELANLKDALLNAGYLQL